ncbi:DUF3175 domain-containing protein [Trinickia terrae]|uniref:DUF3175 domain-containing protein n=1 Tax=Trinickia terrae TaxID=2571161 RepID=A0A4U1HSI4_9BURK|nr:DUF3175 domain-containing protein [Trinickia terrae]TKC83098.1 DUF3175 domain-containing protein [Trinickia terrae]
MDSQGQPWRRTSAPSAAHRAKAAKSGAAKSGRKGSHHVMETSDAMDIGHNIFKTGSAQSIAESLRPVSRNLPKARRDTLQPAKRKLREAFGRASLQRMLMHTLPRRQCRIRAR